MKTILQLSGIAIISILLFVSCKKNNKEGRYIPKNAAMVFHINGKSISEKLPWEEIRKQDYFKTMYADSSVPAFMKLIMDNPESSGIDITTDMLIFLIKDSAGGYAAMEGTVKDKAKFAAMQSKANPSGTASEKEGLYYFGDAKAGSAWSGEKFVMVADMPQMNAMQTFPMRPDSGRMIKPEPVSTRDVAATAKNILMLQENQSLATDEKFSEITNSKGDMHVWMNMEQLASGIPTTGPMAMVNMQKLYQGYIVTAAINFDAGKILMDTKSYAGKEMTEIWKKYGGVNASMDMVKRIPIKNIAAVFSMNFKPEGIREFLKLAGLDGLINMGSAFLGFNLDDFIKANKGEILLSAGDITKDSLGRPSVQYLFSATIGDKDAFMKLINAGKKMGEQQMAAGRAAPSIFYNLNEKIFAIGNNKNNIDLFVNKENNSNPGFINAISGSPAVAYINFQYILNSFKGGNFSDSLQNATMDASLKIWDNLIMKGGDMEGNASTQHVEINLINKTENSLKQLNSYANQVHSIMLENRKKQQAFMKVDSTSRANGESY